jgi:hypothetical protein
MKPDELAELLDRSETHKVILGNYSGPYSLGVTRSPDSSEGYAFLLKIADARGFPSHVNILGHTIRLVVRGGFKPPKPLHATA